jgi:hypothetical protein
MCHPVPSIGGQHLKIKHVTGMNDPCQMVNIGNNGY